MPQVSPGLIPCLHLVWRHRQQPGQAIFCGPDVQQGMGPEQTPGSADAAGASEAAPMEAEPLNAAGEGAGPAAAGDAAPEGAEAPAADAGAAAAAEAQVAGNGALGAAAEAAAAAEPKASGTDGQTQLGQCTLCSKAVSTPPQCACSRLFASTVDRPQVMQGLQHRADVSASKQPSAPCSRPDQVDHAQGI